MSRWNAYLGRPVVIDGVENPQREFHPQPPSNAGAAPRRAAPPAAR